MRGVKISKAEEKELKHKARRLSIKEGIFYSVRNSFGDRFVAPFAIAIGTPSPLVAIIASLWDFGSAAQLFGAKLIGKKPRKSIFKKSLLVQSLAWIILASIGILYLKNIWIDYLPYLIIFGFGLMVFSQGIGHPAWFSWMGDIVDEKFMGRWFSKRNTIIAFTTVILSLTASLLLTYFKKTNLEIVGFVALFAIAFIARFSCIAIVNKQYEPPLKKPKKTSFLKFLEEQKGTNFGKFLTFRTLYAIAMGITTPLVYIYLLRDLQLNYFIYTVILLSGSVFTILTLDFWGKIADKYGNYRVIALTTIILPLVPLSWILSSNILYLILVPAIIGGTTWGAFIMSSGNFIYDNIKTEKRGEAVSLFNILIATGAFIGGLIGSGLLKIIHTTWIEPLFLIFIIGTLTRMAVVTTWVPQIRETKHKKKLKNLKELEKLVKKEAGPTFREEMHQILEIKNYLKER